MIRQKEKLSIDAMVIGNAMEAIANNMGNIIQKAAQP